MKAEDRAREKFAEGFFDFKDIIEKCTEAITEAVEAERAACAEVVRSIGGARWGDNENDDRERIAAAIEARGNPKT